jgi:hypothetical protein
MSKEAYIIPCPSCKAPVFVPDTFTTAQAATLKGIERHSMARILRQGHAKYVQVGRSKLFRLSEIERCWSALEKTA